MVRNRFRRGSFWVRVDNFIVRSTIFIVRVSIEIAMKMALQF